MSSTIALAFILAVAGAVSAAASLRLMGSAASESAHHALGTIVSIKSSETDIREWVAPAPHVKLLSGTALGLFATYCVLLSKESLIAGFSPLGQQQLHLPLPSKCIEAWVSLLVTMAHAVRGVHASIRDKNNADEDCNSEADTDDDDELDTNDDGLGQFYAPPAIWATDSDSSCSSPEAWESL